MTIREALNLAQAKLKNTSTSPILDAEVLLCFILKKSKEFLFINPSKKLTHTQNLKYKKLIAKRTGGWPVAYLMNHKSFYGLGFYVDKNVLIPRPVTEELVDMVLEKIRTTKRQLRILDIGTGSGCIIISLAKYSRISPIPPTSLTPQFFASDISAPALNIARKNAKANRVKISFKQGNLLQPWGKKRFDVIVANLPYLPRETDPSTKHEPKLALVAKKNGLALIEQLFQQLTSSLTPARTTNVVQSGGPLPSALFLEIGHDQTREIKKLASEYLPAFDIKVSKDLTGQTRFAVLSLKSKIKL